MESFLRYTQLQKERKKKDRSLQSLLRYTHAKKKSNKGNRQAFCVSANVQTRKAIVKLFALHAITIMLMCSVCQMLCQMSIFKYFQSVFRIRNYLRKTFKTEKFKNITSF